MKKNHSANMCTESFLSRITEAVPGMIVVYNIHTGEYIYVNRAVEKILGYKPEVFIRKGLPYVASLVHPNDMPILLEKNNKALEKANSKKYSKIIDKSIVDFEYRMKHKNGSWRWLHTDGIVLSRNKDGKVEVVMNISIDITARKEAEETVKKLNRELEERVFRRTAQLKKNEMRYSYLLHAINEAVWSTKMNEFGGVLTNWWSKITGQSEKDARGKNGWGWLDVVHLEDYAHAKKDWKKALQTGNVYNSEFRIKNKKGGYVFLHAKGFPIKEEDKIVEWIGTFNDVTQEKKAEETQSQIQFLAALTQSIPDAVIGTSLDRKIISWNKGAEEIYGWKAEEVIGKIAKDVLQTEFKMGEEVEWREIFHKKGFWSGEVIQRRKDGTKRNIQVSIARVKDSEGNPLGGVGVNRDITLRKQLERQKDDFISMASHELKTPLTSIKVFVHLLEDAVKNISNPKIHRFLNRTTVQIERLTHLVNDLLDVTKMQSGKLDLQKEYFLMNSMIKDSIENIQPITNKHIILVKGKIRKKVYADRERISQVLINLLTNAVKYSPKAKKIVVEVQSKKNGVEVCVKDNGIGIPKEHLRKVFGRFYRVYDETDKTYGGLGMGLYIASEIINRHGGEIWVESRVNEGSSFYFTIPSGDNRK